ncbi:unnamed protein product [Leptosia nina]|uniref:Uncharacterized protein n=1 Tax=Leptosia nina TaxID=320188 RepID=A0AAV1IXY1_9NEOP
MESPVRIILGAALVVNILLLSSTNVRGHTLNHETTPAPNDDKISTNTTWVSRNRSKLPNVALNELHKDASSEENTEKNAKYKDRGRVKFNIQSKSSTQSSLRRRPSTVASNLVIVTPTPEVKKPLEIIDSMHNYKKTKLPFSSTTESIASKTESEVEDRDQNGEIDSYERYTSSKFSDTSFYTFPTYGEGDLIKKQKQRSTSKERIRDYTLSFEDFSSYPEKTYNTHDDPYKSDSFFDFDTELTTPRSDFFDKKYHEVSSSIVKNLDSIKAKISPPPNATNVQTFVEKLSNDTPSNKTRLIIKNTKEIHLMDNDSAGTDTKGLSDVHGTSIYYEMSVLSTESYNITDDSEDDDCDNDTSPSETTQSTPLKEELASIAATQLPLVEISTPSIQRHDNEIGSTIASYFLSGTIPPSTLNTGSLVPLSFQNSIFASEKPTPLTTMSTSEKPKTSFISTNRNRNYSKRLNLTGMKETANNVVTQRDQVSPNLVYRQNTRRFHYTTPKIKPVWMAPRRNTTKVLQTRPPITIYSEHFDIKNKYSTQEPTPLSKVLTTSSSDIDPVVQSDFESDTGKRVVHSHSFVDNTIPSLWKRGSTKYSAISSTSTTTTSTTTTTTTTEVPSTIATSTSDLEIPPTLTAWALASLRSPPPLGKSGNGTSSMPKNDDENELQNVGEIVEKKHATTSSTTITSSTIPNQDYISKNITEIIQNKLPWKPFLSSTLTSESVRKENISETIPAESKVSLQSREEVSSYKHIDTNAPSDKGEIDESQSSWVASTVQFGNSLLTDTNKKTSKDTALPSAQPTKSTGFESITKLPADMTTPSDDTITDPDEQNEIATDPSKVTSTDYEITTIRFSYVPTEKVLDNVENEPTTDWYYAGPLRSKPTTTIEDVPITTYRPKYYSTTNDVEKTTDYDTTVQAEVSTQTIEQSTEEESKTTTAEITKNITTDPIKETVTTELPVTTLSSSSSTTTTTTIKPTTELIKTTTQEDPTTVETTSIVVTIATEINTDTTDVTEVSMVTSSELATETQKPSQENIDYNEVITQNAKSPVTTDTTTIVETTTEKIEEIITTEEVKQTEIPDVTTKELIQEITTESTDDTSKTVNDLEDLTSYGGEMTTEASSRVLEEAGSGAAIAIAVSTIGVIALVLLIGLLVVVRRRGRRGVYAQRCTPVSLDAYSLDSVSVGHRKGNQRLRASKRSYGNPAYDDEVTSHPMNYAALANFALDMDSITAEFSEIPSVTVRPEEVPPGCEDKNRYSNVLPLPETRVPLKRIGNDSTTEYINANYITGPGNIKNYYIACQAPLSNTVVDFWRMIWEQNSRLVVMLTEYMENGVEKCYEYLPPSEISDNRRTFGEYQIILKKREQRDKYAISCVQLINLSTRTWREVTHLWYFWPAKGVPDDYESVIDFLSEMRSYMKMSQTAKEYDEEGLEVIYEDQNRSSYNNLSKLRSDENSSGNGMNVYSPAKAEELLRRGYATNGTLGRMKTASEIEGVRPCVVVCASGAGRSAALIAADICSRALAAGSADLPRAVRALRTQRPHSISNRHHYIFLYKLLSEYGNRLMGGGVDTI